MLFDILRYLEFFSEVLPICLHFDQGRTALWFSLSELHMEQYHPCVSQCHDSLPADQSNGELSCLFWSISQKFSVDEWGALRREQSKLIWLRKSFWKKLDLFSTLFRIWFFLPFFLVTDIKFQMEHNKMNYISIIHNKTNYIYTCNYMYIYSYTYIVHFVTD